MKKIALMFVLLIGLCTAVQAQSCDCLKNPFSPDPPCWNICTVNLLARVGLDDLVNIVGIQESVAQRIVNWDRRGSVTMFREYGQILSDAEINHVMRQVNSLSDDQLRGLSVGASSGGVNLTVRNQPIEDSTASLTGGQAAGAGEGKMTGVIGESSSIVSPTMQGSKPLRASRTVVKPLGVTTYYYYKDERGEWHWRLRGANGRTIAESSEGYPTKAECLADISRVKKAAKAPVKME